MAVELHNHLVKEKAIDKALTLCIEITWLYHDISKCFVALHSGIGGSKSDQHLAQAMANANTASAWAEKAVQVVALPEVPLKQLVNGDPAAAEAYRWLLYTHVLKAQVLEKKADMKDTVEAYQAALKLATQLEDTLAAQAIQGALQALQ
jgi:hypothetical protein